MNGVYKASPSRTAQIVGWLITVLLASTGGLVIGLAGVYPREQGMLLIAAGSAELLLVMILLFFVPRAYEITAEAVIVRRWGPDVRLALDAGSEARRIRLSKVVRVCGVGGFFGAWGWFRTFDKTQAFRQFRAYLTRNDTQLAVWQAEGKVVVLSPDDAEGFLRAFEARNTVTQ